MTEEEVLPQVVTIVAIWHCTTYDNEQGVASGHNDVALSPRGLEQARELSEHHKSEHFDAVFTSDLQRAVRTGDVIFAGRGIPLLVDARLRECDYGIYTGRPHPEVNAVRHRHIAEPFPNGESYQQVAERMWSFLQDLLRHRDGSRVMLIGHGATFWGLEHWIKGVPLADLCDAVVPPPPWVYELREVKEENIAV